MALAGIARRRVTPACTWARPVGRVGSAYRVYMHMGEARIYRNTHVTYGVHPCSLSKDGSCPCSTGRPLSDGPVVIHRALPMCELQMRALPVIAPGPACVTRAPCACEVLYCNRRGPCPCINTGPARIHVYASLRQTCCKSLHSWALSLCSC